jgi:Ala-tRNA(Pro) deacylase
MPLDKLTSYLDKNNVKYIVIKHSPAFTSQEIAARAHIPGKELAKSVMLIIDGKIAMAVLPASYHVDFQLLEEALGATRISLATEEDFKNLFPDCEIGAMPPFGNLYDIDVYVAKSLTEDKVIFFNAGTHSELIKMAYRDFERLVKPKILKFSEIN